MTAPTPAVRRGADASWTRSDDMTRDEISAVILTAALSDPDDPDSLARTLFVLYVLDAGIYSTAETAVGVWALSAPSRRARWRAVADGLRMMLTGSAG